MTDLLAVLFIKFLYFTPIGYILDLISLDEGKRTPGIYLKIPRNEPMMAYIKPNPTGRERVEWFINGLLLLLQSVYILNQRPIRYHNLVDELAFSYALMAFIFGFVSLVVAVFPNFPLNLRFKFLRISILEIMFVLVLIACVAIMYIKL